MRRILFVLFALVAITTTAHAEETKTPYVIWCKGNNTLYFTCRSEVLSAGDDFTPEGSSSTYTITNIWSGDQVVKSGEYSNPAWYNSSIRNYIFYAVIESSFSEARPKSLYSWFYYNINLSSITGLEYLNTSETTTTSQMFYYCQSLTSLDLSHFDTSKVERMYSMFFNCKNLQEIKGLDQWDTSSVTSMYSLFNNCNGLTSVGDISKWDTSNVAQIYNMFLNCKKLENLDLSRWKTDNVVSFNGMFSGCILLTTIGDVSGWNISKATSTTEMFKQCLKLETLDVSGWDMSNVITMDGMFMQCSALETLDVSNWDVSKVVNLSSTFRGLSKVETLDLSRWHTSRVITMNSMFYQSKLLTQLDLSGFYTSNVTDMSYLFRDCTALQNVTVSNLWSVANAASSSTQMFYGCVAIIGQDGTTYDSGATDASKAHYGDGGYLRHGTDVVLGTQPYAIYDAESTTLYLCQSDQTLIAGNQFTPAGSDTPITIDNVWYGKDVCETADNGGTRENNESLPWNMVYATTTKTVIEPSFANVRPTRTDYWFSYFNKMTSIDGLEYLNTSEVTTMKEMFNYCELLQSLSGIENYDVSKVVDMEYLFCGCKSLESLDISRWDMSQVTNALSMFNYCSKLTSITGIEEMDVENLQVASYMFAGTPLKNLDLSGWNRANLANISGMFDSCKSLETLNLDGWKTDHLTTMNSAFIGCSVLKNIIGIENFNTENVTTMSYLFSGCSTLESLDLSKWKTSNVWSFRNMFAGCTSLRELNVNSFDITGVNAEEGYYQFDLGYMFYNCSSLTTLDLSNWDTSHAQYMAYMFNGCENLQAIYVGEGWDTDNVEVGNAYHQTNDMFEGCLAIIGEDGTTYDENDFTIARAHYSTGGYLRCHHDSYTITIPSSGIGTFSAAENVTIPEGLTAHYCNNFNPTASTMTVEAVSGGVIPAHTGVLVRGAAGETYTLNATTETAETVTDNALVAVTVPTHVPQTQGDYTNFMLKSGKFIMIAEQEATAKMPANKAYLQVLSEQLPSVNGSGITLVWDTDGIHDLISDKTSPTVTYDLTGRRVSSPSKGGVYIVNGKKMVVK